MVGMDCVRATKKIDQEKEVPQAANPSFSQIWLWKERSFLENI